MSVEQSFIAQAQYGNLQTLCKIQHNCEEYMHTFFKQKFISNETKD